MPSASDIRLIISDVDGVWTDGRIIYAGERTEVKEFNVRDGLAVKLVQRAGITVALLTSRRSHAVERRARELGIREVHQGTSNKLAETLRLAENLGTPLDQVLYAGDDLPDLAPMARVAISAAPLDAAPEVRAAATWQLESAGGHGAFREIAERLLRERGEWDGVIEEFLSGRPRASSI
jgi:3-deoxy-D-manno-octulosonate 8-phosphate phosphatase (KDO 8-P phosphatase)